MNRCEAAQTCTHDVVSGAWKFAPVHYKCKYGWPPHHSFSFSRGVPHVAWQIMATSRRRS